MKTISEYFEFFLSTNDLEQLFSSFIDNSHAILTSDVYIDLCQLTTCEPDDIHFYDHKHILLFSMCSYKLRNLSVLLEELEMELDHVHYVDKAEHKVRRVEIFKQRSLIQKDIRVLEFYLKKFSSVSATLEKNSSSLYLHNTDYVKIDDKHTPICMILATYSDYTTSCPSERHGQCSYYLMGDSISYWLGVIEPANTSLVHKAHIIYALSKKFGRSIDSSLTIDCVSYDVAKEAQNV